MYYSSNCYNSVLHSFIFKSSRIYNIIFVDSTNSVDSLAYYSEDTYTQDNIYPSKYYETQLNLTWAFASTTVIDYSLTKNGGESVPSWIAFDSSTGKLKFTAPLIWTKKQYSFKVEAYVHGDNVTLVKIIYLSVNAKPMCQVSNWDK